MIKMLYRQFLWGWDSLGNREIPLNLPWRVLITIWGCGDTEVPQFKDLKIKEKYSKKNKKCRWDGRNFSASVF